MPYVTIVNDQLAVRDGANNHDISLPFGLFC